MPFLAPFLGLETGLVIAMQIAILLQKYVFVYQVSCVWDLNFISRICPKPPSLIAKIRLGKSVHLGTL